MPAEQAQAKWEVGFASEDMRPFEMKTLDWHMRFIRLIYPYWGQAYAETLLKRFDLRSEQKIKGLSRGQRVKTLLLLARLSHGFSSRRVGDAVKARRAPGGHRRRT